MIGDKYIPNDNSYCININTNERARIVQFGEDDWLDDYVGPNEEEEDGAEFTIVSEEYEEETLYGNIKTFVNVQSSLTGSVYRILFE